MGTQEKSSVSFVPAVAMRLIWIVSLVLVVSIVFAVWGSRTAFGAFSQPFECQVSRGANGAPPNFEPGGIALDKEDNLWIGDLAEFTLDEFSASSCAFLGPEPGPSSLSLKGSVGIVGLTDPSSLSIDDQNENFYATGSNSGFGIEPRAPFVEVFDRTGTLQAWNTQSFGSPAEVVIDNSTTSATDHSACGSPPLAPSECFVYVRHGQANPEAPESDGSPEGIQKFSTSGTPIAYGGCGTCSSYVIGNSIVGTPTKASFQFASRGIAVDSSGDLFTDNGEEVDEFKPSGEFVRAYTGGETPGLGGSNENNGFGGNLEGVAVDPVSGLLAIAVEKSFLGEPSKNVGAVDEFDTSNGKFLNQVAELEIESKPGVKESGHLVKPQKVAFGSQGNLYVVDNSLESNRHTVDVYGPGRFIPAFRPGSVTDLASGSAVLNAALNPQSSSDPEKTGVASCVFEYVTEEAFETEGFSKPLTVPCVPGASEIAATDSYQSIHADLGGLEAGVTYLYRPTATIAGKLGGTAHGNQLAFTAPHAPRIESLTVGSISSQFADLQAQINPLGAATKYHFEFVSQTDFEATGYTDAKATSDVGVGSGGPSGNVRASVVQEISGLRPDTSYRVRVVAENASGTTSEPEATFRTLPAGLSGLPDGRADELVTPSQRIDASDLFAHTFSDGEYNNSDIGFPATSGDAFLFETSSAFGAFPSSGVNLYVFRRDPSRGEWTSTSLASPSLGVQSVSAPMADLSDLSKVGFVDAVGSHGSDTDLNGIGLVGFPGGPYSTIFAGSEVSGSTTLEGASNDLSHIVLQSVNHGLAPGDEGQDTGSTALYDWNGEGECNSESENCKLVDIDQHGNVFKCGALLGQSSEPGTKHNAVSANGSKLIFTAPDPLAINEAETGCRKLATKTRVEENPPQLYMRTEGATIEVSAPEPGWTPEGPIKPTIYVGASEEDSQGHVKIFFVTETELTKDDAGRDKTSSLHDPELYEYDTATGKLTRISAGEPGSPVVEAGSTGAHLFTVPAVSASGSAVYFTARGELKAGLPTLESEKSVYLYRYDVQSGSVSYIAMVGTEDYPSEISGSWWAGTVDLPKETALNLEHANWYTTPDGNYLLFGTTRELVPGHSTVGPCAVAGGPDFNGHCDELYRYHYEPSTETGGSITCVSCDSSGALPVSDAEFARSTPTGPSGHASGPPRAMSDDGKFIFFDTADALLPQDGNGTLDVYEWHEGDVALISSGADAAPSFFLGADPSGHNVFFGTHSRLVPQDTNSDGDIYDARVCSAEEPCIQPPSLGTAQCEGDACQSPPAAPIDTTPVSLTFSGAGNLFPPVVAVSKAKAKSSPRAILLRKALQACKKRKPRRARVKCEAQAQKRYGTKGQKVKAKPSGRGKARKVSGRAGK
jgi:hypothetical protein